MGGKSDPFEVVSERCESREHVFNTMPRMKRVGTGDPHYKELLYKEMVPKENRISLESLLEGEYHQQLKASCAGLQPVRASGKDSRTTVMVKDIPVRYGMAAA
jgi:hypothetical protein